MVNKKEEKLRYTRRITTFIPEDGVSHAVDKLVSEERRKYSKYTESDLAREAIVSFLQKKGYLDKDKLYL